MLASAVLLTMMSTPMRSQNRNSTIRIGAGSSIYGKGEGLFNVTMGPASFAEFDYTFSPFWSMGISLYGNLCDVPAKDSYVASEWALSPRVYLRPFGRMPVLNRLEFGAGPSLVYQVLGYDDYPAERYLHIGLDIPIHVRIVDTDKFDFELFYEPKIREMGPKRYTWFSSNLGLSFGVKF